MSKPIIFVIDDDPDVLRAIENDLRREYGGDYRVMRSDSGAAALDALRQLRLRSDDVALFVVDQRMPQITGIEFLEEARKVFPDARRVILTAYADTEVAIRAINVVGADYYLMKPWDPPEEHLYPVLRDLLDDWHAVHRHPFEGIRVIGYRWSPKSHHVKEFLARNLIPFQWLDVEQHDEATRLLRQFGSEQPKLPVVVFPDGTHFSEPTNLDLAHKVGLQTEPETPFYDLIIIGGGPAGLAAAVYGASEGLETCVIEKDAPGGQAGASSRIENYLGFPVGLSGADLARRAVVQAKRLGAEILTPQEAESVRIDGQYRFVKLANGKELACHAVMIATGISYHLLSVPGAESLAGAGIYYGAATSEAATCQGQDVFIVGAGNSAGQAAMYFSRFARSVTVLVRGDNLAESMSQYLIDQIIDQMGTTENIHVRLHTEVVEAHGTDHLEELVIHHRETGKTETVPATALFVFIGARPRTEWLGDLLLRDEQGYIITGPDLCRQAGVWSLDREPYLFESSVPGIFVSGDVRHESVKRVASAVGEGSMAIQFVHRYLGGLK